MKQTSKITLEILDTMLSDLLDEVLKMKAMLSLERISLEQTLESLNAKRQEQEMQFPSLGGVKKPKSRQPIMPKDEASRWTKFSQPLSLKREGNQ